MFERFRFGAKRGHEGDEDDAQASGGAAKKVKQEPERREPAVAPVRGNTAPQTVVRVKSVSHKWQERWHGICGQCFQRVRPCTHYMDHRLRLLIVGHNPSENAWQSGYSYSNPTNRMWMLLTGNLPPYSWEGILPANANMGEQNIMPHVYGVGFADIGLEPGNDAAKYGRKTLEKWKLDFFRRLRRHAARVCLSDHQQVDSGPRDCMVKREAGNEDAVTLCARPHAPILIAFSGKRHFGCLFSPPLAKVESFGKQTRLPQGWPTELRADSEVWVLPSSSGRAAMTKAQRTEPYQQLAARLHEIPWTPASHEPLQADKSDKYDDDSSA